MAIKSLFHFDHVTPNLDLSTGTLFNQYTGYGGIIAAQGSPAAGMAFVDANGYLNLKQVGGLVPAWHMPLGASVAGAVGAGGLGWDPTKTRNIVGFRFLPFATPNNALLYIIQQAMQVPSNNYTLLLVAGDVTPYVTAGTPVYIEIEFNRSTNQALIYLNGVLIKTVVVPMANYGATAVLQLGGNTNVATFQMGFRDIYVLDDLGDGLPNSSRLGSIRSNVQPLASVSAQNYSLNAGSSGVTTPIDALNTALGNPPAATPNIQSSDNSPVIVGVNSPLAASAKIVAVQTVAALQVSATSQRINSSLVEGSNVLAQAQYAAADASMKYAVQLGFSETAPDGGAWSTAKVNATSLDLTPA